MTARRRTDLLLAAKGSRKPSCSHAGLDRGNDRQLRVELHGREPV